MTTRWNVLATAVAILLTAACGPADGGSRDEGGEVGTAEEALAPAGSNAQFVSSTIPTSMYPGERRVVSVTMKNTGVASPANDWTASPQFALAALNNNVDWHYAYVGSTVPTGATTTFSFVITAPPASAPFSARMLAVTGGPFGDTVTVPITVSTAVTPQWGCTMVSTTLPAQLAPGENRVVTFTVRNTGTATWPATNLKLATRDVPANLWGATGADLTAAVAPGGTATFAFALKAPATVGTYAFQRDMKDYAGIGDFRRTGLCVSANVVVGGAAPLAATVVSQDFPAEVLTGETKVLSVVMKNAGSQAWAADGKYMLYSLNTPVNGWGRTLSNVSTATVSGGNAAFSLSLSALLPPGTYHQRWQMRKVGGTDASFFGAIVDVPVTIADASIPAYDAVLVSQSVPATVPAGKDYPVTITLKNTGRMAWAAPDVILDSHDTTPDRPPARALAVGEAIGRGQTRTFSFTVRAPIVAGPYVSAWQLYDTAHSAYFGETARADITVGRAPSEGVCPIPSDFPLGTYRIQGFTENGSNDFATIPATAVCNTVRMSGDLSIAPSDEGGFDVFGFAMSVTDGADGVLHFSGGDFVTTGPSFVSRSIEFDLDPSTGFLTNYSYSSSGYTGMGLGDGTLSQGAGWLTCGADTAGTPPAGVPEPAFSPDSHSFCDQPKPAPVGCGYEEVIANQPPPACTTECGSRRQVSCAIGPQGSYFSRIALCCP